MSKKKKKSSVANVKKAAEKRKITSKAILPIIVCSVLGVLLLFGIVLGTIAIVREAGSVVSYEGIRIDRGTASYLASTYKASYKGDKSDTAALEAATEKYIRRIAVAAYLYDRVAGKSDESEKWVERNTAEVLEYKAEGSVEKFNEIAKPMGFDYKDFVKGTELIYKAVSALDAIYGVGGSALSYSENAALAEEYFMSYTHVKVLFIRTENKYALDENGDRVPNGDGTDMTVTLSAEERAERLADIAKITELIENAKNGVGTEMSLEEFDSYYEKYNDEPEYADSGYYLHPDSDFTRYLKGEGGYPHLAELALSMDVGEWGYTTDGDVTCFVYKYAPIMPDYASSDLNRFFTDFYADAAEHFFMESVDELSADVRVKKKYAEIDVAALEKNSLFKIMGVGIGMDW